MFIKQRARRLWMLSLKSTTILQYRIPLKIIIAYNKQDLNH